MINHLSSPPSVVECLSPITLAHSTPCAATSGRPGSTTTLHPRRAAPPTPRPPHHPQRPESRPFDEERRHPRKIRMICRTTRPIIDPEPAAEIDELGRRPRRLPRRRDPQQDLRRRQVLTGLREL